MKTTDIARVGFNQLHFTEQKTVSHQHHATNLFINQFTPYLITKRNFSWLPKQVQDNKTENKEKTLKGRKRNQPVQEATRISNPKFQIPSTITFQPHKAASKRF